MLLQCLIFWTSQKTKTCIYELEKNKEFHLLRLLAILTKQEELTNHKWIHANPDIILEVYSENKDFIDDVSNHLWACDVVAPALNQIVHWITVRAKQGYKLICIDPITAATMRTGRQWEEEKVFLQQVDKIGRQYGCSFLFVTHPQKQTNMAPNMQYLAGSANYSRFADTILWLEGHQEKTGNIKTFI